MNAVAESVAKRNDTVSSPLKKMSLSRTWPSVSSAAPPSVVQRNYGICLDVQLSVRPRCDRNVDRTPKAHSVFFPLSQPVSSICTVRTQIDPGALYITGQPGTTRDVHLPIYCASPIQCIRSPFVLYFAAEQDASTMWNTVCI